MQYVGRVVEQPPHAMAAEVPHHGATLAFGVGLDCRTDGARALAGPDSGNAAHQAFVGDLEKPLCRALDLAYGVHPAGIAVPAVENVGDVDIDDVSFLERLGFRNAVADDVVHRGAARF